MNVNKLARPDGRPEAYDVPNIDGQEFECGMCADLGLLIKGGQNEIFMMSPAYFEDGKPHFLCREHLPDNTVIYNPETNKCRDKSGENEWEEK